jgi:hypothetical protein
MARDIPGCPGCESGEHGHGNHDTLRLAGEFGVCGDQFCREGELLDASRMYERQIEQLERAHGKESAELIPALLNAADACRSCDRKGRSTELFTRALALLEQKFGLTGDDPASVLDAYSAKLEGAGKHYLAVQMGARAKAIRCRRDA